MAFPEYIQSALRVYDQSKGVFRQLFGDAPAIRALRALPEADKNNYNKLIECFLRNMPIETQASYQVYKILEANPPFDPNTNSYTAGPLSSIIDGNKRQVFADIFTEIYNARGEIDSDLVNLIISHEYPVLLVDALIILYENRVNLKTDVLKVFATHNDFIHRAEVLVEFYKYLQNENVNNVDRVLEIALSHKKIRVFANVLKFLYEANTGIGIARLAAIFVRFSDPDAQAHAFVRARTMREVCDNDFVNFFSRL